MRTDKVEWFLDMAERCARQGTCLRRVFGALIVDQENTVISTGYNGAPHGSMDCLRLGKCWRKENSIPSGSNYEKCRAVHSELNAIMQAGKAARGSTLYLVGLDKETGKSINAQPCSMCARATVNAQVEMVVMRREGGKVIRRIPREINALWEAEIFEGVKVNWALLQRS